MSCRPPRVVVYSTSWCPWCDRARSLLDRRGVAHEVIDAEERWGARFRDGLEALTGGRTVPQIVIDGRPIGGYENLAALDLDGGLAALAESRAPARERDASPPES